MARKPPGGSRRAPSKGIRKDGFVFAKTGLDAILADYLYNQVPDGKRRDMMKRLMLLGLIEELGLSRDRSDYIPPRPVDMMTFPLQSALNDHFIDRSTPVSSSMNDDDRLLDDEVVESELIDERRAVQHSSSSEVDKSASLEDREASKRLSTEKADGLPEPDDELRNGLNVAALAGFMG